MTASTVKLLLFYLIILCVFTLTSCKTSTVRNNKLCPVASAKVYTLSNGFCSSSIFINSDSTFLYERGCEGSSRITLGQWKIIGDSIELEPLSIEKIDLVCGMSFSKNESEDFKTVFFIVDKIGNAVKNFTILPLKNGERYTYSSDPSIIYTSKNIQAETFETDTDGYVTIATEKFDTIDLAKLSILSDRKYRLSTQNISDTVKITLNINSYGLMYFNPKYSLWNSTICYKFCDTTLQYGTTILRERK